MQQGDEGETGHRDFRGSGWSAEWCWVARLRWRNPSHRRYRRRRSTRPRRPRRRPHPMAAASTRRAAAPPPPAPAELPPPEPPADPLAAPPPPPPANPFAPADPLAGPPLPIPEGTPAGQNPTPFVGEPVFLPPSFNPINGSMVGVAKPIYINFQRPIANRPMAEQAIHISSIPPVPGRFYWISDTQVRWRPQDFWPADTVVNIDAAGAKSSFRVGESAGGDHRQQDPQDGNHAQRQAGEDLPGVDGQEGLTTPPTAPTTCWRSSPTS